MKPKYLMQEAISWALRLVIGGAVIIGVSIHMALSDSNSANIALIAVASAVVAVLGAFIISRIRYCRLDENGITFYCRFKKESFVSWKSITDVKSYFCGRGRGFEKNMIIFNDEYNAEPVSPADINEEDCARGFRILFGNDSIFAEYLKHYRGDIEIKEKV